MWQASTPAFSSACAISGTASGVWNCPGVITPNGMCAENFTWSAPVPISCRGNRYARAIVVLPTEKMGESDGGKARRKGRDHHRREHRLRPGDGGTVRARGRQG